MNAKRWVVAKIGIWLVLCAAHFVFRTHSILSGPKEGDLYAYSWSFQAIMFLIFRFPFWLIALVILFRAELLDFLRPKNEERA